MPFSYSIYLYLQLLRSPGARKFYWRAFWGVRFFDVWIFNPHAPSHLKSSLSACYHKQESLKKCAYNQRVREVEHSSFTPLVLSATGGMANEATTFWHHAWQWNGTIHTPPYPGCAVAWCFLYSNQPSSASGVPGLAVDMLPDHNPSPPLTWPSQNCNSIELSTLPLH